MAAIAVTDTDTQTNQLKERQEERIGRIEPVCKPDFPHEQYPRWIGHKFTPDGSVLPFPGNTIICHLPPSSELYRALLPIFNELQQQTFSSLYTFLPPSSWHMTVFEGISGQIRKQGSWPGELVLDASLEECNSYVAEKLKGFGLNCTPPFKMMIAGWEPLEDGIALKVVPSNASEESRLRDLRNRIAAFLKMHHPGHETYSFHISMAYTLCFLDEEERTATMEFLEAKRKELPVNFELVAPEFCVFENMMSFHREFFLR